MKDALIWAIVGVLLVGGTIWIHQAITNKAQENYTVKTTQCFDKFGNVISGVTCEEKVYPAELNICYALAEFMTMAGLALLFFGTIIGMTEGFV